MLAYGILVVGALASFYCYTRLAALLPMRDPTNVTEAQARVTKISQKTIQKSQVQSDVPATVDFQFTVQDHVYHGSYKVRATEKMPVPGDVEPIAYVTAAPNVFLRLDEYRRIPSQLTALRAMLAAFALAAMVLPFVVLARR